MFFPFIGQFWNIPVNIERYTGEIKEESLANADLYVVTIQHPLAPRRQFVGLYYTLSWEFQSEPCLYVGNRQGGPIREVDDPNDSVIEGDYTNYIVAEKFGTNFQYSVFNQTTCLN